jgi:gentisate 1,2-dioxygenase
VSTSLGRLEDLPPQYVSGLREHNVVPLWPSLREAIPHDQPGRKTQPTLWRYGQLRPELMRAGALAPIEKAERRVLVLCNPGLGLDTLRATPTIYIGLQLILPGEFAPTHRHTPCAVRFVIEGEGGHTTVGGEKLPMHKGDLILTPSWLWHEHGHEGTKPVVWLDALDLPLIYAMEASYSVEGYVQPVTDPVNSSRLRYARGGVIPYGSLGGRRTDYPLMRYPWAEVKSTLEALAGVTPRGECAHLAYVNPETGAECLPTLGFSAMRLAPREPVTLPRRSASAVLHVVEGRGSAVIDGTRVEFSESDTVAVPTHAAVQLEAGGAAPAHLFMVDDAPLQRKIGIYQVFERGKES